MGDIPLEHLLVSDYASAVEHIKRHSRGPIRKEIATNSIMIDSYREIPRSEPKFESKKSLEDEEACKNDTETALPLENQENVYSSSIYKRLSSMLLLFNKFMFSNEEIASSAVISSRVQRVSGEAATLPNDLSIRERIYDTMDNIWKRNRKTTGGLVALVPSLSINIEKFDLANQFVPEMDNFADCFALFIEDQSATAEASNDETTEGNPPLDSISYSFKCEIVNKKSQEILSESGPYHCVFEEEIDTSSTDDAIKDLFGSFTVQSGKLRLFRRIKPFSRLKEASSRGANHAKPDCGKSRRDCDVERNMISGFIRQRLCALCEYLSRGGEGIPNRCEERNYSEASESCFSSFKENENCHKSESLQMNFINEAAKERFEEHIRLHTDHWNEVQYDNIEIILRGDDNNSIVKLPYACKIM